MNHEKGNISTTTCEYDVAVPDNGPFIIRAFCHLKAMAAAAVCLYEDISPPGSDDEKEEDNPYAPLPQLSTMSVLQMLETLSLDSYPTRVVQALHAMIKIKLAKCLNLVDELKVLNFIENEFVFHEFDLSEGPHRYAAFARNIECTLIEIFFNFFKQKHYPSNVYSQLFMAIFNGISMQKRLPFACKLISTAVAKKEWIILYCAAVWMQTNGNLTEECETLVKAIVVDYFELKKNTPNLLGNLPKISRIFVGNLITTAGYIYFSSNDVKSPQNFPPKPLFDMILQWIRDDHTILVAQQCVRPRMEEPLLGCLTIGGLLKWCILAALLIGENGVTFKELFNHLVTFLQRIKYSGRSFKIVHTFELISANTYIKEYIEYKTIEECPRNNIRLCSTFYTQAILYSLVIDGVVGYLPLFIKHLKDLPRIMEMDETIEILEEIVKR